MSSKRYTEEFKIEAVKQVTERGYPVKEVAERLGVNIHSLYEWRKKYGQGTVYAGRCSGPPCQPPSTPSVKPESGRWSITAATISPPWKGSITALSPPLKRNWASVPT